MNYYARINNNRVVEIIELPNSWVLGKDIFDKDFAEQCVTCDDTTIQGMLYNPQTQTFSVYIPPEPSINDLKIEKEAEIKTIIAMQEQKIQRSSQAVTKALLTKQEASQADIDAFNALHSAKKLNQTKLVEVVNATSKEQVEAIKALQVEYKNGAWLEV